MVGVSRGVDNFPELPEVHTETRSVAALLASRGVKVRLLVNDDASCAAVLDGLREATLAHIACHGTFEPDRPDRSGLVLIPRPGHFERLTLRDLSGLELKYCRHVTLSSCWSADNFILPGRWIISLPETLWRSGAGSALGCLWPVDDEVAGPFMSRLYGQLADLPRDAALREAQLACLANKLGCTRGAGHRPIDTRASFYWAGFNLYGEPGRLRL